MGKIADFLDTYNSEETKRNYGSAIRTFLAYKYGFTLYKAHVSSEILEKQRVEADSLIERYFTEHDVRNPEDRKKIIADFKKYTSWTAGHYTPKSCQYYNAALRQFFEYHGVEIQAKDRKEIKRSVKKGGPETREVLVSKDNIRKILMHSPLKLQALVLLISSSGLRINEALTLDLEDIELFDDYGKIYVRGEKSKNRFSRITFCSKEAVTSLKEWLSVREKYLDGVERRLYSGEKKIAVPVDVRRKRLFGYGDVHARDLLEAALEKGDLNKKDSRTRRSLIHFHSFRKFFDTTISDIVPPMYVSIMMGHQSALDKSYKIPDSDKIRDMYLKCEPFLRVNDESAVEIAATKEEIRIANDTMRDIRIENLEMKSKLQDFEKMQERVRNLERIVQAKDTISALQASLSEEDRAAIARMVADELKRGKKA